MFSRVLILAAFITSAVMPMEAAEQSIADTGRQVVSTPTPTPHRKKKSRKKRSPSASPVRVKKKTASPSPSQEEEKSLSPSPSETASLPTPAASGVVAPTSTVSPSPSEMPAPQKSVLPQNKGLGAPNVTLSPEAIANFESYPPKVQKLLTSALELTTRNLDYKYGSADPARGGMDCSGFIYYVLNKSGISNVPRDAREQYIWVRKAGKFQAVLGRSQDTFELDALKPGDLLFWAGTYKVDRDPAITHTMIYLGREKATNQRVMVGASDGRTYKGQSRFGVSVFDFKIAGRRATSDSDIGPTFVGYASIPGQCESDR